MSESRSSAGTIRMRYGMRRGDFALDVSAELSMRGITGVFGPSGAGKTSLLRCIAGLERPTVGKLVVDGDVWQDWENKVDRPTHQREIGYVFQEPRLFPHLDIRDNLNFGRKRARRDHGFNFDQVVDLLGLESLLHRRTQTISGGEAQRVAIGRALLRSPRVILMDEPVVALDAARRDEVLPFIDRLHSSLNVPVLYVSHNIDEICLLCDQLLVVDKGSALAHGPLQEVLMRTDLPVLAGDEAGSLLRATCTAYDEEHALSEVAVSAGRLWVPGRLEPSRELRLRLRANDISLARERPRKTSILNLLPATIEDIQQDKDASVLVHLNAGEDRLLSRITRRSAAELALAVGDDVIAQVKSVSVRATHG